MREWPIAPNILLRIRSKEGNQDAQLTLQISGPDGTRSVDMSVCTKPPAKFELHDRFACDPQKDVVSFPPDALKDPRNIFSILHELGHVTTWHQVHAKDPKLAQWAYDISEKKRSCTKEEMEVLLEFERIAWAEAIHIARKLKEKEGIHLFTLFRSAEDLMGWLRATGLRTYEHNLEQAGATAYTKCDMVMRWWASEQSGASLLTIDDLATIDFWMQVPKAPDKQ